MWSTLTPPPGTPALSLALLRGGSPGPFSKHDRHPVYSWTVSVRTRLPSHTSAPAWLLLSRHFHLPGRRDSLRMARSRAHHLQITYRPPTDQGWRQVQLTTASQACADSPHEPDHGVHVLHQCLVPPEDLGSRVLGVGEPVSVLVHQGLHPTSVEYSLKEPAGTKVVTQDSPGHTAGCGCGRHGAVGLQALHQVSAQTRALGSNLISLFSDHGAVGEPESLPQFPHLWNENVLLHSCIMVTSTQHQPGKAQDIR